MKPGEVLTYVLMACTIMAQIAMALAYIAQPGEVLTNIVMAHALMACIVGAYIAKPQAICASARALRRPRSETHLKTKS